MHSPLLSYYGDDLTGSTDVMEALSLSGVPTVLFLSIPSEELRLRFAECRAFGLAGTSRSETPVWMDENLATAFTWLRSVGASICHYKVCSTFDSGPEVGNIGRAVEIGRRVFNQSAVPIVVGAPQLKRYTAFGNLFAAYRGKTYRIDRHPVMSRHPVTPMNEADLLIHLSHQTDLRPALVDLAQLALPGLSDRVDEMSSLSEILLFDVADPESQRIVGRELWRWALRHGPLVAGSSGVEYALLPTWIAEGLAPGQSRFDPLTRVGRLAVVSGSVSPTTEAQIQCALNQGFKGIPVDPLQLSGASADSCVEAAVYDGLQALEAGQSVVIYTALGPQGDRGREIDDKPGARHQLGRGLGDILRRLVIEAQLSRAVIAGGDTSSHALARLGVDALTVRLPLPQTPGSPLCKAHSSLSQIDGLEIALKGGQIGSDDYFCKMRDGI